MTWEEAQPPSQQASHDASTPLLDMAGAGNSRCVWRCQRHPIAGIADFPPACGPLRRHIAPSSLFFSPLHHSSRRHGLPVSQVSFFLTYTPWAQISPHLTAIGAVSATPFSHHFPNESRQDSVPLDKPLPRSIRHAATLAYGLAGLSFISVAAVAAGLWAKTYEGLDSTKVLPWLRSTITKIRTLNTARQPPHRHNHSLPISLNAPDFRHGAGL